jgi:hypothetical protein
MPFMDEKRRLVGENCHLWMIMALMDEKRIFHGKITAAPKTDALVLIKYIMQN